MKNMPPCTRVIREDPVWSKVESTTEANAKIDDSDVEFDMADPMDADFVLRTFE